VSSVVKPSSSSSGSALILVLLITALLSTIAVSFLSTSRVEQIAAKNFSRQNAASGLAEMATQQAMANLQTAFNDTGSMSGSYAAVVTSQPGGITKYFFQNGACTTNPTAPLFFTANSANANGTVNINNLDNSTNSTVSGLITGNRNEVITVARVNVLSNSGNQTIGRIAYYIDDESTKINLNSLEGTRDSLNARFGKAQSLSGVVSSTINGSARFSGNLSFVDSVVSGLATSSNNSITTWTSFFRPEQAQPSFSINDTQIKHYSAAPLSDFHLKYTPWGTQRLFINDEPIDDTGVSNIYSALTGLNATTNTASGSPNAYEINGRALQHIFNGSFADKYSFNGTKQIAANMLQMRDKNTVNQDFNWRGPILGSANMTNGIPQSYFAFTPFAVINEILIQPEKDTTNNTLNICVYLELWCPFYNFFGSDSNQYGLNVVLQSASGTSLASPISGNISRSIPAFLWGNRKSVEKFVFPGIAADYNGTLSVAMGDIKLLATPGNASSIRDWITGPVINKLLPINTTLNSSLTVNYTANGTFFSANTSPGYATIFAPWQTTNSTISIQRKDVRIKQDSTGNYSLNNSDVTSPWGVAVHSLLSQSSNYTDLVSYVEWAGAAPQGTTTKTWEYGDVCSRPGLDYNPFTELGYFTSDWPSDHMSQAIGLINFRFFNYNRYFCPTLQARDNTGNATNSGGIYIWPADLGKVMTDRQYRTLRMFWQPTQERARGFIPDWALLDLVSFSSNQTSKFPLKISPMNLNGSFNCLAAPTPRPRNNIQCLTKPFDSSLSLASSIARTTSPLTYWTQNMGRADWLSVGANVSVALTSNLTQHITSNSAIAWTRNGTNTWNSYRTSKSWPSRQLILPSEIAEIKSVADYTDAANTNPALRPAVWYDHLGNTECNENRLAAFFPGFTLQSNFFTIYAYAQALDNQGNIDSEALTKTLVEVEITTPATATAGAVYKVKKLYTQPIPLGQ